MVIFGRYYGTKTTQLVTRKWVGDLTGDGEIDPGLRLVKPCAEFLDSYLEACREFKACGARYAFMHEPDAFDDWKDTIFTEYDNAERGIGLPDGWVPYTVFWSVHGSEYVGTGSVRHRLTAALEVLGGHIGYSIRPSRWNQGFGTAQLRLLLREARNLGIDPALVTCDLDNPASARVMVKNGGRLIDTTERLVQGERRMICRYQVPMTSKAWFLDRPGDEVL